MDKAEVARALRDMGLMLKLKGESPYKVRAYEKGASAVEAYAGDLEVLAREGRLAELPGVGESLAKRIAELFEKGRSSYLEDLAGGRSASRVRLLQIPGIDPKRLDALVEQLGVEDLVGLEQAARDGRVRAIKRFGEKFEEKLLAALAQARAGLEHHKLGEVMEVARVEAGRISKLPGVTAAHVAGSVRRFAEVVSNLDLVAAAEDPARAEGELQRQESAERSEDGRVLYKRDQLPVRVRIVSKADEAWSLLRATGSKAHLSLLDAHARQHGFDPREDALLKAGKRVPFSTEEEIYRALSLPFIPPELREEVFGLSRGGEDLITLEDVQGLVHSHTTWSDGKDSLEDMAKAAQAAGLRYLTVTDHSQAASYAGGLTAEDLVEQWDEMKEVEEKVPGVKLLRGAEVDILEDGSLDYPEKVLEKLDVVIGSVHVRHKLDEDGMTKRVVKALRHPLLHILGHATGRLIHRREPYGLRMEEVMDVAAERGVAIEVNGSPDRLDLKAEHVQMALARGVKLTVSSDSHSTGEVARNLFFAVGTARRGGARKSDVLNARPVSGFLSALEGMRR